MTVLQSRHLQACEYDPETQALTIWFVNGAVHRYKGVPQTTADVLPQASSAGSYFHDKIRGRYPEVQLREGITKKGNRSRRRF